MAHSGAGSAASMLVTQQVVHAFVRDFTTAQIARVSQVVVLAFVNDTVPTTPPTTGVNTGTPVCRPYPIHLDRMCRLLGDYDVDQDTTSWILPVDDSSLTTVVLADTAFGSDNGLVITATYQGSSVISATGDRSAGHVIVGRGFTMSVELSRPYRRDVEGVSIVSDRLQHTDQYFAHRNTGDYTVRAAMPSPPTRTDRTRAFTVSTVGAVQEQGELRTMLSGWAEQVSLFVESTSPRPCAISSIKYGVDVTEDQG